jgi:hypothetical protein
MLMREPPYIARKPTDPATALSCDVVIRPPRFYARPPICAAAGVLGIGVKSVRDKRGKMCTELAPERDARYLRARELRAVQNARDAHYCPTRKTALICRVPAHVPISSSADAADYECLPTGIYYGIRWPRRMTPPVAFFFSLPTRPNVMLSRWLPLKGGQSENEA